jgi:tricorn protease-like protein
MTDDRTLLEKAAKAAGIHVEDDRGDLRVVEVDGDEFFMTDDIWNPLIDDGDALRLAVKLCMDIRFDSLPDGPVVKASAPWLGSDLDADYYLIEWLGKDSAAATRRAIVRAAASLSPPDAPGKNQGEQG